MVEKNINNRIHICYIDEPCQEFPSEVNGNNTAEPTKTGGRKYKPNHGKNINHLKNNKTKKLKHKKHFY
jgi:hypothetical protein